MISYELFIPNTWACREVEEDGKTRVMSEVCTIRYRYGQSDDQYYHNRSGGKINISPSPFEITYFIVREPATVKGH